MPDDNEIALSGWAESAKELRARADRIRALVEAGDELAARLRLWVSDSEMASTDESEGAILAWEQTR